MGGWVGGERLNVNQYTFPTVILPTYLLPFSRNGQTATAHVFTGRLLRAFDGRYNVFCGCVASVVRSSHRYRLCAKGESGAGNKGTKAISYKTAVLVRGGIAASVVSRITTRARL